MQFMRTFLINIFLLASCTWSTTYYIRPDGADNKDGLSDQNAWKTIGKVQTVAGAAGFQPGDSILFKAGVTHTTSTTLYLPADISKGTAALPITISSYGTGRATIQANGCMGISVWAPASGQISVGLKINNLNLVGNGVALSGPKSTHGISVWNSSSTAFGILRIEDCDVSGFAGNGISAGRDDKTKGRISNVLVKNVVAHDNPGAAGLAANTGSGIVIAAADGAVIENCITYNNGANNNNPGGPIGIWFYDCINSTIQNCESYNNQTINGDGGGFDLDGGCKNCIIQYCYSHNNAGAGYLLAQFSGAYSGYGPLEDNIIRYNISQNDGRKGNFGGISFWGNGGADYVGKTDVYNNTIYMGGTAANGAPSCVYFLEGNVQKIKIRNNIFVAANGYALINATTSFDTSKVQFQGNCFWSVIGTTFQIKWGGTTHASLSAWRTTGQEMVGTLSKGLQADPLLKNPGAGGTIGNTTLLNSLAAYQLEATSPAINAGLNLQTLFGINPGTRDFWGNAQPQGNLFDIGACEYSGTPSILKHVRNNSLPELDLLVKPHRYDVLGRIHVKSGTHILPKSITLIKSLQNNNQIVY